jgi:hypothetical protein
LAAGLVVTAPLLGLNCSDSATPAEPNDGGPGEANAGGDGGGDAPADTSATSDGGGGDAGFDAGPACSAANPCADSKLTCCDDHCVDTKKNASHCGACGVKCTTGSQFCNGVSCKETLITNVCETANATLIQDGITEDDTAGTAIGTALGGCTPAVTVRTVLQAAVEGNTTLNILATGGAPLAGPGDMLVTAGGEFGQHLVKYMETKSSAPVISSQAGTTITFARRSNGQVLRTLQEADLTTSHDFALIAIAVDASSGTLTLMAQGLLAPGTRAASFYLSQVMIPTPATYDQAYYLYEWTDADADFMPDANEFVLVSSGK